MFFRKKKQKLEDAKLNCIKNMTKLTETIVDDNIRILFTIKDVDDLKMIEQEKNNIRGNLVNKATKDLLDFQDKIKELSKTAKSIR